MMIKNEAKGGRGLGIAGCDPIEWAPGETKDVDDAVVAKAKKDPTNAAMFEEGGLVVVTATAARVSVNDESGTEGAKDEDKKAARK